MVLKYVFMSCNKCKVRVKRILRIQLMLLDYLNRLLFTCISII